MLTRTILTRKRKETKMKHSETPWTVEVNDSTTTIESKYFSIASDLSNEDAERIVACVNACEPNGAVVKALKDTENYYLSNGGHEAYTQLAGVQSALAALEIK